MTEREEAERLRRAVANIRAEGTSDNPSGYGPPYRTPWHILDTSRAEPEVNWPGELIETVEDASQVSERLAAAQNAVIESALTAAVVRGRASMREDAARTVEDAAKPYAVHTATSAVVFRAETTKLASKIRAIPSSPGSATGTRKELADRLRDIAKHEVALVSDDEALREAADIVEHPGGDFARGRAEGIEEAKGVAKQWCDRNHATRLGGEFSDGEWLATRSTLAAVVLEILALKSIPTQGETR